MDVNKWIENKILFKDDINSQKNYQDLINSLNDQQIYDNSWTILFLGAGFSKQMCNVRTLNETIKTHNCCDNISKKDFCAEREFYFDFHAPNPKDFQTHSKFINDPRKTDGFNYFYQNSYQKIVILTTNYDDCIKKISSKSVLHRQPRFINLLQDSTIKDIANNDVIKIHGTFDPSSVSSSEMLLNYATYTNPHTQFIIDDFFENLWKFLKQKKTSSIIFITYGYSMKDKHIVKNIRKVFDKTFIENEDIFTGNIKLFSFLYVDSKIKNYEEIPHAKPFTKLLKRLKFKTIWFKNEEFSNIFKMISEDINTPQNIFEALTLEEKIEPNIINFEDKGKRIAKDFFKRLKKSKNIKKDATILKFIKNNQSKNLPTDIEFFENKRFSRKKAKDYFNLLKKHKPAEYNALFLGNFRRLGYGDMTAKTIKFYYECISEITEWGLSTDSNVWITISNLFENETINNPYVLEPLIYDLVGYQHESKLKDKLELYKRFQEHQIKIEERTQLLLLEKFILEASESPNFWFWYKENWKVFLSLFKKYKIFKSNKTFIKKLQKQITLNKKLKQDKLILNRVILTLECLIPNNYNGCIEFIKQNYKNQSKKNIDKDLKLLIIMASFNYDYSLGQKNELKSWILEEFNQRYNIKAKEIELSKDCMIFYSEKKEKLSEFMFYTPATSVILKPTKITKVDPETIPKTQDKLYEIFQNEFITLDKAKLLEEFFKLNKIKIDKKLTSFINSIKGKIQIDFAKIIQYVFLHPKNEQETKQDFLMLFEKDSNYYLWYFIERLLSKESKYRNKNIKILKNFAKENKKIKFLINIAELQEASIGVGVINDTAWYAVKPFYELIKQEPKFYKKILEDEGMFNNLFSVLQRESLEQNYIYDKRKKFSKTVPKTFFELLENELVPNNMLELMLTSLLISPSKFQKYAKKIYLNVDVETLIDYFVYWDFLRINQRFKILVIKNIWKEQQIQPSVIIKKWIKPFIDNGLYEKFFTDKLLWAYMFYMIELYPDENKLSILLDNIEIKNYKHINYYFTSAISDNLTCMRYKQKDGKYPDLWSEFEKWFNSTKTDIVLKQSLPYLLKLDYIDTEDEIKVLKVIKLQKIKAF